MTDRPNREPDPLTLAFVGRVPPGGAERAAAYEDAVLPLLVEHGGEVVFRGRQVGDDPALPAEVQLLRVPSEAALDAFLADERRAALQAEHGDVFADTTVVPVTPVGTPSSDVGAGDELGDDDVRAAAESLVARVEEAQQREDVDAFLDLFRDDALWTTAHGKRLVGLAEIGPFTRSVLPGAMAESTATYRVTQVVRIRPDVAAVHVRQQPVTLDGTPIPDQPEGRPIYVIAREPEGWRIVAAQNTQVVGDR